MEDGGRDKEKERKINQLLEDDRKKVLELATPDPDEELPFHFYIGTHQCDVEYTDEKFISIAYSGWAQRALPWQGFNNNGFMATTIGCEEMKVLELKDVVSDMKGVCQMLMEDRFEAITLWDGVEDLEKVSTTYSWGEEEYAFLLLEHLNGDDRDIEWYIKERKMSFSERWSVFWGDDVDKALTGKDFVIVTLYDSYYHEYAIDMRYTRRYFI